MPPIVHETSDIFRDQRAGAQVPDATRTHGRLYHITGTVENAADDLLGSTYLLFRAPSDCIPHESTFFDVENDGYATIRIGTAEDDDALVDQLKTAANVITPFARGGTGHQKKLWEVLGLPADPGGVIAIYKHGIANAAGAGKCQFRFAFLYN